MNLSSRMFCVIVPTLANEYMKLVVMHLTGSLNADLPASMVQSSLQLL